MSNFEIQWKALNERKDEDDPEVPKITKALPIIKWTEAFQDFLNRVIGDRMIPLAYEMQLYQAMKLRSEHGQFAMNIGASNILDHSYLDDNDNNLQASNDDDGNSMDD